MRIGHQKGTDIFQHASFKDLRINEDITVKIDAIQSADTSCIGWLLGAHPKSFNADEYAAALKAHSLIRGKDLEIRIHQFRLEPRIRLEEDVKVVHIYCRKREAGLLKTTMNKIYGSSRKSDSFPLGRNYRFVPYTADPLQPVSPGLRRLATEAFLQQKNFTSQMVLLETDSIAGLDYYIKNPVDATLREVLMAMKASDGVTSLFDAVDTRWDGSVSFLVHSDLVREANSVIPFLPLMLATKFGPRAWGWFHDWVRSDLAGMHWDETAGRARSGDEDNLAADLADWAGIEELESDDEEAENETIVRVDLDLQIYFEAAWEQ